ncbi:hypothetical protein ACSSS7_003325 [Eimeria intestinalis]
MPIRASRALQNFRSTAEVEAAYAVTPRAKRNPSEVDVQHNRTLLGCFWLMAVGTFWSVVVCGYLSPYVGFHNLVPSIRRAMNPALANFLQAHDFGWGLGVGDLADSKEAHQESDMLWFCTAIAAVTASAGLHMALWAAYCISLCRIDSAWRLLHEPPPAGLPPPADDDIFQEESGITASVLRHLNEQRQAVHNEMIELEESMRYRLERELLELTDVPWLFNGMHALNYDRSFSRAMPHLLRSRRPLKEGHGQLVGQQPTTHARGGAFSLRVSNSNRRRDLAQKKKLVKKLRQENAKEQEDALKFKLTIALQGSDWRSVVRRRLVRPIAGAIRALWRGAREFWSDCYTGGPLVTEISGATREERGLQSEGAEGTAEWIAIQGLGARERTIAVQELLARHLLAEAVLERLKKKQIHRHRNPDMLHLNPFYPYNTACCVGLAVALYCLCWLPLGLSAALTSSVIGGFANFYAAPPSAAIVGGPVLGLHALAYMLIDLLLTGIQMWRARIAIRVLKTPHHVPVSQQLDGDQQHRLQQLAHPSQHPNNSSSSSSAAQQQQQQQQEEEQQVLCEAADGIRCSSCDKDINVGSFYVSPPVLRASVVDGGPDFRPTDGSRCCMHAMHVGCYFSAPAPWCCTCASVFKEGCRAWQILITPLLIAGTLACVTGSLRLFGVVRSHRNERQQQQPNNKRRGDDQHAAEDLMEGLVIEAAEEAPGPSHGVFFPELSQGGGGGEGAHLDLDRDRAEAIGWKDNS